MKEKNERKDVKEERKENQKNQNQIHTKEKNTKHVLVPEEEIQWQGFLIKLEKVKN